jgi:hypothetical protein
MDASVTIRPALPGTFEHWARGLVDAYVMVRKL